MKNNSIMIIFVFAWICNSIAFFYGGFHSIDQKKIFIDGIRVGASRAFNMIDNSKIIQGPVDCKTEFSNSNIIVIYDNTPPSFLSVSGKDMTIANCAFMSAEKEYVYLMDTYEEFKNNKLADQ